MHTRNHAGGFREPSVEEGEAGSEWGGAGLLAVVSGRGLTENVICTELWRESGAGVSLAVGAAGPGAGSSAP